MDSITQYLQRFRSLTSYEGEVKEVVLRVILRRYQVSLDKDCIKLQGKNVFISTHSALKNRIYLEKPRLLQEINEQVSCVVKDLK